MTCETKEHMDEQMHKSQYPQPEPVDISQSGKPLEHHVFFWVESQTMNPGGIMLIFHRWDVLKGVPKIDDSIAQGSATLAVPCLEMMTPFQGLSRTGVCRPWYTKMKGMFYREKQ
jgi:hypothetical protein